MSDERNSAACKWCSACWILFVPGLWVLFGVLAFNDKPGWGWALLAAFLASSMTCKKFCLSAEDYERMERADANEKSAPRESANKA